MSRLSAVVLVLFNGVSTRVDAAEPIELPIGDTKVFSLAFSPDAKHLAYGTGGSVPTVKVVDVSTKMDVCEYPCPGRGAGFTVAFSPDGKLLALGDYDLNVKVINAKDATEVASLPGDPDRKKYRQARRLAFLPDGKKLVVGYSTGEIFVWDLMTMAAVVKLEHSNEISALAVSPDGQLLATGTDFGLRIWKATDGSSVIKLDKKSSGEHQVQAIAFMPDGKSVATGDSPGFIRIFATSDGKELASFKAEAVGRDTTVSGLAVTKNGKSIVYPGLVSGLDPQRPRVLTEGVVVMDSKTMRPQSFLQTGSARLFALSPDGKTLALNTGDKGDSIMLHDMTFAENLKSSTK